MALVNGTPFIEMLIDSLAGKGIRDFVLLVGYLADIIEKHFAARDDKNLSVRFSRELEPLGTGGAVKNAEHFASDPSLLVNGDTFFDGDIHRLLRFHREKVADVTLSLLPVRDVRRYGSVTVDKDGLIRGFREKYEGAVEPGFINAGFSLISRDFIGGLPADRAFSMEREILPKLAQSGRMFGLISERSFFDIGTPESYDQFKKFIEDREELNLLRE